MIQIKEKTDLFNLVGSTYGPQVIGHSIPLNVAAHAYGVRKESIRAFLEEHSFPAYKLPDDTLFLNPNIFSSLAQLLDAEFKEPFTYADLVSGRCSHCR